MTNRILLFLLCTVSLGASAAEGRVLAAAYAETVRLDARMTEECWTAAERIPLELVPHDQDTWPEAKRSTVGAVLREKGYAKLLWNREYLYIGVAMEDSDVVAEGTADQTHLYRLGDTVEVFIKPKDETYYWEFYGAANGLKSVFFYPGRGRLGLPGAEREPFAFEVTAHVDGTLNDWRDHDAGWSVVIAVPLRQLERYGKPFATPNGWTLLVARQNYSARLPVRELSSCPALSVRDFHLTEEYATLRLIGTERP